MRAGNFLQQTFAKVKLSLKYAHYAGNRDILRFRLKVETSPLTLEGRQQSLLGQPLEDLP
jgi:hypothetical protein